MPDSTDPTETHHDPVVLARDGQHEPEVDLDDLIGDELPDDDLGLDTYKLGEEQD